MWNTYPRYLPTLGSWVIAATLHLALLGGLTHLSFPSKQQPKASALRVQEIALQMPSTNKTPRPTSMSAPTQSSALAHSSACHTPAPSPPPNTLNDTQRTHASPTKRQIAAPKKSKSPAKKVVAKLNAVPSSPSIKDTKARRKRAGDRALAALAQMGNPTTPARPNAAIATYGMEAQNARTYEQRFIAHLQRLLELPECGNVRIELSIGRDGCYISHRVICAESRVNQSYLEAALPKLTFAKPEKEPSTLQTLTIDFSYRS